MTITLNKKRRKQYELAIAALLSSKDRKAAALACNISYSTMNRLYAQPDFQKAYADAKTEVLESVKNGLRQIGMKAVSALDTAIDNPTVDTSDKLSASRFVIDRLLDLELRDDLATRLAAIEADNASGSE